MNIGKNPNVVDEDSSFCQQPMSSQLVFDSVKHDNYFPLLNEPKSFGTVD